MSVTEQLMGWGSWSLTLRPETMPGAIWSVLDPDPDASPTGGFGHILITPAHVDPNAMGDAAMLAVSKYTGLYRGNPFRNQLKGVGLVGWLGDEDGKGDIYETAQTGVFAGETTGSFIAWVKDLLPAAIEAGTITNIAGTLTESLKYMTPRAALDRVMAYFGGEYRVNPDGTLDAGTEANLFATTPEVILIWKGSGPDQVRGLRGKTIELARDLDDFTSRLVFLAGGTAVGTADNASVPYKDLHGNTVVRKRLVSAPEIKPSNATPLALAQLARFDGLRRSYRLSTDEWGIAVLGENGLVEPGDSIWVYDPRPDAKLIDPANEISFHGEMINPIKLRLQAMSWPIQEGMGVYFRYYDGATPSYVDLTNHVVFENGDTTLDVGAAPRRLTTDPAPAAVQARVLGSQGILGYAQITANHGHTTTEADCGGVTVTVDAGTDRRLKITVKAIGEQVTGAGNITRKIMRDSTEIQRSTDSLQVGEFDTITLVAYDTPTAGSHTYKARGVASANGFTCHAAAGYPMSIAVEDIGPA